MWHFMVKLPIFKLCSLYMKLAKASLKSQMQYPASFVMLSITNFFSIATEIFGIWVLFDRFKMVNGWSLKELFLIYGIIHIGFSLAEAFARSFEKFTLVVKNGDFDRILLRPLGTLLQVAVREIQLARVGRLLQGIIVLILGYCFLNIHFFSLATIMIILSIAGTFTLFYGVFIIQAALIFWTSENLSVMDIVTYGAREAGQYPMSLYHWGFKLFFTLAIPLACVVYYPMASLLQKESIPLMIGLVAPLSGLIFLYLAMQFWKKGVRHYHSTGS
jgi:ABC-2 type transport system permease protein